MLGGSQKPQMERVFSHVLGNAALEPVTPARLAIYLLIKVIDKYHRHQTTSVSYIDHVQISVLVQLLLSKASLTFKEMTKLVEKYMPPIVCESQVDTYDTLSAVDAWKARIRAHKGYPVTVLRDDIIRLVGGNAAFTGNMSMFVLQSSTIGLFVRRLALACGRQTETEITNTHKAFIAWTGMEDMEIPPVVGPSTSSQEKGTARRTLFGGGGRLDDDDEHNLDHAMEVSMEIGSSDDSDSDLSNVASSGSRSSSGRKPSYIESHSKLTPHLNKLQIAGSPLKRDMSTVKSESVLAAAAGASESKLSMHTSSPYSKFNPPKHFEFMSSSRIRDLILKQLHCIQVCPQEAMQPEELQTICKYVKDNYSDLPSVHLLEALNDIRCKRVNEAGTCLRLFFDWHMIRLNNSSYCQLGKLAKMASMPLRFGPLLSARLYRIFGNIESAQHLLYEAVQQAEADKDQLCMRLCLIEQAALELLSQGSDRNLRVKGGQYRFAPIMIDGELQHTTGTDQSTVNFLTFDESGYVEFTGGRPEGTGGHVAPFPLPNAMGAANTLAGGMPPPQIQANHSGVNHQVGGSTSQMSTEVIDSRAFLLQLNHSLSLIKCVDCARKCTNYKLVNICLERLMYADYGPGRETQARLISDCARAIISTLQLGAGLFTNAAATSEHMLNLNQGDIYCSRFDTEPQVIAGVNNAYALCSDGKFDAALSVIERLKERFDETLNWMDAKHWKTAEVLIQFDRCFFNGELKAAEMWLRKMQNFCPEEADLRGAIMYAIQGKVSKALDTVDKRLEKVKKTSDFLLTMRCEMVRSQVRLFLEEERNLTRAELVKVLDMAVEKKIHNFVAMIARRLAYVSTMCGKYDEAQTYLNQAETSRICTNTPTIERCLFQICSSFLKLSLFEDKRVWIYGQEDNEIPYLLEQQKKDAARIFDHLSRARILCQKIDCVFLEKQVVQMALALYDMLDCEGPRLVNIKLYNELHKKCPSNMPRYVVVSNDRRKFRISPEALQLSPVWGQNVKDHKANTSDADDTEDPDQIELEVANVDGSTLQLVVEWCEHYRGPQRPPPIPEGDCSAINFSEWDLKFLKSLSGRELQLLAMAAKYFQLKYLLASCMRFIYLTYVHDQTVEKIRAFFTETDDFTYEEKEYMRYEREWLNGNDVF